MKSKDLFKIWQQGHEKIAGNKKITKADMEQIIKKRVRKKLTSLNLSIFFYIIVQLITLVLLGGDLYGYRSNPSMLATLGAMLLLMIGFLAYSLYVAHSLNKVDDLTADLATNLSRRLGFFKTHLEAWIITISFGILILIFSINVMVDNMDGHYRINKPGVFFGVNFIILLFMYAVHKASVSYAIRALKIYLKDLNNQVMEGTEKLEKEDKKMLWFYVVIFIILTAIFILGIIKAMN